MMRKGLAILLAAMCFMVIPALAQDEGPGLEGVTGDPGSFWGQTITFEGVLVEYINPYSFVMGEGAALDDDRVLVINDTGMPLPANLIRGERIRVTGIVLPGIDARDNDPNASPFVDDVINDTTRMGGTGMGGTNMTGTGVTDQGTTDVTSGGGTAGTGGTGDTTSQNLTGTAMPETPLAPTPEGATTEESTVGQDQGATPGAGGGATGGEVTPMMEATMDGTMAPGMDTTMSPEMTGVPEMTMQPTMDTSNMGDTTDNILPSMWEDGLAFYWNGNLPDDFNGFTIVRLVNVTDVEWLPLDDGTTP